MTRTLLAALTAALIVLGLAASPASAATREQYNPRDAGVPSSYDLRKVTYTNGDKYLQITVLVQDLRDVRAFVSTKFSTAPMRRDKQNFRVTAIRDGDGGSRVRLESNSQRLGSHKMRCKGLRRSFSIENDRVTMRVPQLCLGEGTGAQRLDTSAGRLGVEQSTTYDRTTRVTVRQG